MNADAIARITQITEIIIKGMVDDEAAVHITVIPESMHTNLQVTVAPGDFGKVIGTNGYLAKSIRQILGAIGNKLHIPQCMMHVVDPRPEKIRNRRGDIGGRTRD